MLFQNGPDVTESYAVYEAPYELILHFLLSPKRFVLVLSRERRNTFFNRWSFLEKHLLFGNNSMLRNSRTHLMYRIRIFLHWTSRNEESNLRTLINFINVRTEDFNHTISKRSDVWAAHDTLNYYLSVKNNFNRISLYILIQLIHKKFRCQRTWYGHHFSEFQLSYKKPMNLLKWINFWNTFDS